MKPPASPAPPGATVLTWGQLASRPETAELLPPQMAEIWGVEFDQRDSEGLILKALPPAAGLIVAAALCGLVVYAVSRFNWGGLVGAVVLAFLFLLFWVFRNFKRSFSNFYQALTRQPLKSWLIFCPGRLIWLRKTVIGRQELVLDPSEIIRLTLVPYEPVKYRRRQAPEYTDPFERILQKPVWTEKPPPEPTGQRLLILYYRLAGDEPARRQPDPAESGGGRPRRGSERSEPILFERGEIGLCAWAARLIQAAALPRSVPIEELAATPTDPHDFSSIFRKARDERP